MSNFNLARNRDAWFVIRGYKFQVDLSIARWLTLESNQRLVLECGEDIDIVNEFLVAVPEKFDRELEQIKHLDKRISLNLPACKIAVANAVQHFSSNPTLQMIFRFCTNSSVTAERPPIFDDRKAGIDVWNDLRLKRLPEQERSNRLGRTLEFLTKQDKTPVGLDLATWQIFRNFISTASPLDLEAFISRFEWSTQIASVEDTSKSLIHTLHLRCSVPLEHAKDLYSRLFLHVMQVLSQSGRKILSGDDLNAVLRLPPLSPKDTALLNLLSSEVLCHAVHLATIDASLREHEDAIADIRSRLLVNTFGPLTSPTLALAISDISTTLPPLVGALAMRQDAVTDLKTRLTEVDWFAVYGSVGSGKTQLAALLGGQLTPIVYVSLRDLNALEANFLLHHLFLQLCDGKRIGNVTTSGLAALAHGTTLILDDVPRYLPGDPLGARLMSIADAVRVRSQHLLTFSHYTVPSDVVSKLKSVRFRESLVPAFDRHDVQAVFKEYGAPEDSITPAVAESFLHSTSGNPTLLTAIARTLQADGWKGIDKHRQAIAQIASTGELVHETMFRLLKTVENEYSRELLYRLCIIIGEFGARELKAVGSVSPALPKAIELFDSLQGLWVEQRSKQVSVVCPLIAAFGSTELSSVVEKAVAETLSQLVFEPTVVSPLAFVRGLHYLRRSRNGTLLGLRVLAGLDIIEELPPAWQKLIVLTISLPAFLNDCPTILGLLIKAKQVRMSDELEIWSDTLLTEASVLIEKAEATERWAVVGYAAQAATVIAQRNIDEALRLCAIALDSIEEVVEYRNHVLGSSDQLGEEFGDDFEAAYPWFLITGLRGPADFLKWFRLVTSQPPERMRRIFTSDLARDGLKLALDQLWVLQHAIKKEDREFDSILNAYEQASEFFDGHDLRLCKALVVRSQVVVFAEYLGDLPKAESLANEFLKNPSNDEEMRFIIHDVIGRQFRYARIRDKAIDHLAKACSIDSQTFNGIRFRALIELSATLGDDDAHRARALAETAVTVAKRYPREIPLLETVAGLGEAALATGFDGDYVVAFTFFDEAYGLIDREFTNSPQWKAKSVLLGNSLGYFASMAIVGRPPTADYTVPIRGCLINDNDLAAEWFDRTKFGSYDLSTPLLVMFANAVGRHDRAQWWAALGIDRARASGMLAPIHGLAEELIPPLLLEEKVDQALDCAWEASLSMAAFIVWRRGTPDTDIRVKQYAVALLGEKPNADWQQAEQEYLLIGVIPAIVYLVLHSANKQSELQRIIDDCSAKSTEASFHGPFVAVSNAISSFLAGDGGVDLHKRAILEKESGNVAGALASYLLSSFSDGADLRLVIVQHSLALHDGSRRRSANSPISRFLVGQLVGFWRTTFRNQRFRFSNPAHVEVELDEIDDAPFESRGQRLLRVILAGLRLRLPGELKSVNDWIMQ